MNYNVLLLLGILLISHLYKKYIRYNQTEYFANWIPLKNFFKLLLKVLNRIRKGMGKIVEKIIQSIIRYTPPIFKTFVNAIKTVGRIIQILLKYLVRILKLLAKSAKKIVKVLLKKVNSFIKTIKKSLKPLLKKIKIIFKKLFKHLKNLISKMLKKFKKIIKKLQKILTKILKMIKKALKNIIKVLKKIFKKIMKVLKKIFKRFKKLLKKIIKLFFKLFKKLMKFIKFIIKKIGIIPMVILGAFIYAVKKDLDPEKWLIENLTHPTFLDALKKGGIQYFPEKIGKNITNFFENEKYKTFITNNIRIIGIIIFLIVAGTFSLVNHLVDKYIEFDLLIWFGNLFTNNQEEEEIEINENI